MFQGILYSVQDIRRGAGSRFENLPIHITRAGASLYPQTGNPCVRAEPTTPCCLVAQKFCRDLGGNLAMAKSNSSGLAQSIRGQIRGTPSFWIGGREGNTEGNWLWADNSPISITVRNWFPGLDPSLRMPAGKNQNTRECIMMGYSSGLTQSVISPGLVDQYWCAVVSVATPPPLALDPSCDPLNEPRHRCGALRQV